MQDASTPSEPLLFDVSPCTPTTLQRLVHDTLISHLYVCLLETFLGEHGARMFAMDNATRNADDMIHRLRMTYNRLRQAQITTELTEIIAGAEALV